jgi:2-polyprenyl-3-methyl-5-hydroxy-6-metoxy-1,4-benzoquinol methylase
MSSPGRSRTLSMTHHTESEVLSGVAFVGQHRFGEWPAEGLESVQACPLCGSRARSTLHEGLQDHAFGTAPGAWTLRRCAHCACAYLDPRPNKAAIPLAYARYYTHHSRSGASLRQRFAEAYLKARYGMPYPNAFPGGQYAAMLFPRKRAYLDVFYARHLETATGDNKRLLDVGCGNGEFLQFAAHLGWQAEGIDVDAAAVAAARAAGCNVTHGSLDALPFAADTYRHVVLSHVIEHVYEPLKLLRRCLALLAPGGRLWLQTPNLQSVGHEVFGPSWRGLEPPRHLVLFDRRSLTAVLGEAGFSGIEFREQPGVTTFIWEESRKIARSSGRHPRGGRRLLAMPPGAALAEMWSARDLDKGEFLTCIAYRAGNPMKAAA